MGFVATQGLVFRYVNYWSQAVTWGGEFAPVEGDMVYIPKGLNLLVDIDSTPILSAVVVEGALIFPSHEDPNHLRTFDAHYVMVRGGTFEAGTEQFPYTSKLQITMYSKRFDPELPIFGNKVIAMYNGVLDLHGVPRNPTWTMLDTTSDIGSTTLTLVRDVDWQVGEKIVIAPTGYYNYEAEERTIVAIDNTDPQKPVITIDTPLEFKHYAGIQTFGDDFIEMRAEVGLLTRNILYRGDPETSARNEYGAHIMVHSNGMETLTARIEYIEFFNVGQAFQLGRYPIHFHLIGAVHNSYIKGNAIHQSYNRACTIHGVHYLRVTWNVAFNTKGHTFFIEDAAETKNLLENNLAIWTKKSWSLLNSDQTPASFWITHPDNILRGNHAAGSDNYGYWFDTKPNPTGPSFDPNICPENSPLGEFANNVAHSNGRYGLRVFHKLIPRTNPCVGIIDDPKNLTDPYWQNPLIPARFVNFTSFKNQRNGAIALDVGDVRFENFKVSDNILAGIEFELTKNVRNGYSAQVNGALVIGYSDNADNLTMHVPSHGIIGPRTENFQVHNVKFYNFDVADKAALGSCSHCFSAPSTDSGGRMVTFSNLYFDSTVTQKIRYETPYRDIFFDLDGTLTGLGPNTWATPYWRHNEQPECQVRPEYDGLICNSSVQIRRLAIYNYKPDIFYMMDLKILKYDDSIVGNMDNVTLQDYTINKSNYAIVPWRMKLDPMSSWSLPFVTGHKYKIHWQHGLDWTQMQFDLSPHRKAEDLDIYFVHNFTDVRAQIDFLTGGDNIKNQTIKSTVATDLQTGANIVYNDTATRQIHFLINGKNMTRSNLVMKGYRCVGNCLAAVTSVTVESTVRLWSQDSSWPSGKVPQFNETVVIEPGQNFVFDLEDSPIYNYVQVNGRLTFLETAPKLHLRTKYLFVRAGELIIGNNTHPFKGNAQITLYGEKENQHIVYTNAIEAGNKILANTGLLQAYGVSRIRMSRLLQTVNPGDAQIFVEPGLSWAANDSIALAPSTVNWFQQDYAIIKTYDNVTGAITLDRKMSHYHWGASKTTGGDYSGVDMRTEVLLLTRNVRIVGNDTDSWGCQVLTGDFIEGNGEFRNGRTYLDNVEVYNCSQYDTHKAALRFESAFGANSLVTNCAIHHGLGFGIEISLSANVHLVNNTVWDFVKYGVNIITSNNITMDGNIVMYVHSRHLESMAAGDPQGAILVCAHLPGDKCKDLKIVNNIAAGVEPSTVDTTGFSVYANDCNDTTVLFKDNIAHSIAGYGAIIFKNPASYKQDKCIQASYFSAYKCRVVGIVSNQATDEVIFENMVLIDNGFSVSANIGQEGMDQYARLKNITFYGETLARDCKRENICNGEWDTGCIEKTAIMPSSFANHHKPAMITATPAWPQFKIKADASLGGKTIYENIYFYNFEKESDWCGNSQRLFRQNRFSADYQPRTYLNKVKFHNVHQDTLAYIWNPPNEWSVVDDCGEFPCTGPKNVLIWFDKATYSGIITPKYTEPQFMIISNNTENSRGFKNCELQEVWNAWYCENDQLALITFESFDEDKMRRILSPITLRNMNSTSVNVINTFMDHQWDGFYTSMLRLSRFAALIEGGEGIVYNITYTSTPPQRQHFTMRADYTEVILRIRYPKPGTYIVKDKDGKEIKANGWDATIQQPTLIKGLYCGENRYVGVENTLDFYLPPNCNISIEPIDSIQSSVRLNWTVNEFYKSGGTTQFQDRIAASLGIKPANIKIVSVYQGSVFVDFQILDDSTGTIKKSGGIDKIQQSLTTKLTSGKVDLGAPILSVSVTTIKATPTSVSSTPVGTTTPTTTIQPNSQVDSQTTATGPSKPTPQIFNNTIVQISTEEEAGSNSTLTIAVIASIFAVIVFGGAAGFLIYKKYSRISSPTHITTQGNLKKDGNVSMAASPDQMIDENFEEQYHPKAEIDIFGRNDPFKAKANQADQVDEEEEEHEDTDQWGRGDGAIHQPQSANVTESENHTRIRESRMHDGAPLGDFSTQSNPMDYGLQRKNAGAQFV